MAQTIERTGKPYKALIALGKTLSIIGAPALFFSHHGAASAAALMIGIALYFVGKIGAWWSNG